MPNYRSIRCITIALAALFALGSFWDDPVGKSPGLLVGYASPPRHRFSSAVAALADILAEVTSSTSS